MLAKWITCDVPVEARDRFAAAQRGWSVIADQPGLVGQVGGWDSRTGRAHVLALWADAGSHQEFLRDRHDSVAEASGSTGITIALGEVVLAMSGAAAEVAEAMGGGLLGGVVARTAALRYLVATFWPDAETHRRYAEHVPELRAQAGANTDIASMSGHALVLEPTWRVDAISVTLGEDRGRSVP